jgi:hypothetical protein
MFNKSKQAAKRILESWVEMFVSCPGKIAVEEKLERLVRNLVRTRLQTRPSVEVHFHGFCMWPPDRLKRRLDEHYISPISSLFRILIRFRVWKPINTCL